MTTNVISRGEQIPRPSRRGIMSMINRVLLALGVVAVDLVVFFVPLTAVFMAYILIYNPPWFREFLSTLGTGQGKNSAE